MVTPTIRTKHLDAIVHTLTATLHAIRNNTDIIHYHGVGPSLLSWLPRVFAPRAKVVVTFHCIDRRHQKWNWLARSVLGLGERFACLFPHRTVVVSRTLQSYCDNRFAAQSAYIPNGIQPWNGSGLGDAQTLARFDLEPDQYILMVSRLVRHKGAHHLIDSYKRLKAQGKTQGKKLVIVGGSAFTDGYVDQLKQMAEKDSDIMLVGYQEGKELEALFANSYLAVHPSESEGLSIAVLEAMSYGKAVLCSDIPENMEVARNYGMSFRNRDVLDLSRKLEFMLQCPSLVSALGADAQKFVESEYDWDGIARSVDGLYRSMLSDAAGEKVGLKEMA